MYFVLVNGFHRTQVVSRLLALNKLRRVRICWDLNPYLSGNTDLILISSQKSITSFQDDFDRSYHGNTGYTKPAQPQCHQLPEEAVSQCSHMSLDCDAGEAALLSVMFRAAEPTSESTPNITSAGYALGRSMLKWVRGDFQGLSPPVTSQFQKSQHPFLRGEASGCPWHH